MLDEKERRRQRLKYKKKDRSRQKKRDQKIGDSFHGIDDWEDQLPPSRPEWDYNEED